jgi:2'-hydroxyisoflavone reductase
MKILILGGTIFLGRHLIEAALARGHQITIFNRGRHNPDLYPEIEKLRGDRSRDLSALRERRWDAVIDTCGYVPSVVRSSAEFLAPAAEHYTFIRRSFVRSVCREVCLWVSLP